jgi:hypothetical protein
VGEPGNEHDPKDADDAERDPHPQLLAHDGEDEVGVRLGEEIDLLAPLPQAGAGGPARREGLQGLVELVGAPLLVALDVQERREPPQAVRVVRDEESERRERDRDRGQDVAPLGAREEEEDEADREGQGRGAEVRLEEDEPREAADDAQRIEVAALQVPDPRLVERQVVREAEHHRELGELGHLEAR